MTDRCWMLVASLPALPALEGSEPAPIGRERLLDRLRLLDEPLRGWPQRLWAELDARENATGTEGAAAGERDARAVAPRDPDGRTAAARDPDALAVAALHADAGADAAGWLQGVLARGRLAAALRRQRAGAPAPAGPIGWPAWDHAVRHRWAVPRFGLAGEPWLAALDAHLAGGDARGALSVLDCLAWQGAAQLRQAQRWGFGDVLGWTQQWRLLDRRRRDSEAGAAAVLRRLLEAL
jgi:hypothetical protein